MRNAIEIGLTAAVLLGCAEAPLLAVGNQRPRPDDLRVEASWNQPDPERYGLVLRLINESRRDLEISDSTLWRGNLMLFIVDSATGDRYEQKWSGGGDLPFGSSNLPARQSVEKEINLSSEWPDLWRIPPEKSVVIFWSLELLSPDYDRVDRVGGFLEVRPGTRQDAPASRAARASSAREEEQHGIDVSAAVTVTDDDRRRLAFTLTNKRDDQVKVLRQTVWRGNMLLILVNERSWTVLKEDLFPDDLPPGDWTLRPGESVNAEVDLASRFPQLRTFSKKDPLLVFWTFTVRFADEENKPRFGGYLTQN